MGSTDKFVVAVAGVTFGIVLVATLSLIPTMLWYVLDDEVARISGVPELGNLHVVHVWAATMFLSSIFKSTHTTKK